MNKYLAGIVSTLIVTSIIAGVKMGNDIRVLEEKYNTVFDYVKDLRQDVRFIRDYIIKKDDK